MKKILSRTLSFLLSVAMLVSAMVVPAAASLPEEESEQTKNEETVIDYTDLYVRQEDATLIWDAFDQKSGDTVSESAFEASASASYGDGFLYNNASEINLTSYLPNIAYGDQTAQKDYSIEMVMSTHAPYKSGTGMAVSGQTWYLGNFSAAFYFRQSEHADYLAGNGPISVYVGSFGDTKLDFKFNNKNQKLWLGTTPLEAYTSTAVFDLTLGDTPDVNTDKIQMSFYNNANKLTINKIDNPLPYDASNANDKLTIGKGMRMNFYAIRVYSSVLTAEEMKQNHFADLVGYLDFSLDTYLALPEKSREVVHDAAADILLTDADANKRLSAIVEDAHEQQKEAEKKALYQSLYVSDADGDGKSDLTLLWDAFDKKAGDALSETAFTANASASYGDGYLYNNAAEINLTSYLPNFTYGDQVAQKDYTVELAMSTHAPYESGTGMSVSGKTWYFGNFSGAFYFRQSEHADYLAGNGPISVYVGSFGSTSLNFNFNKNKRNFLLGTTPLESYTSTLSFDLTLGETPDATKDTIQMSFYHNANEFLSFNPIAYDASNQNDKLTVGLGMRLNYYAIRVYSAVLSEAQMAQNHFADLANYFELPLDDYLALPEELRAIVHNGTADIALTDEDAKDRVSAIVEDAHEQQKEAEKKALYQSLYVSDADGDGKSDLTLRWDAFDKKLGDTVLESAFKVSSSASYGDGFLYNNASEIDLTSYLPNIAYGDQTAQKDYSIEMVMSTHAPYKSGTGMAVSGQTWYFGNFSGAFYFRQSEHADYLQGNGPISVYVGSFGSTTLNFNFNKGLKNFWLGTTPLEAYTSTGVFDLTLGDAPDVNTDKIQMSFYNNANKLTINKIVDNPLPYDASNTNDKLTIGTGMRMNYYAIRVYSAVLTSLQMKQNHFADLANYAQIENISMFIDLSEQSKQALYEQFNTVKLSDGREKIKAMLEDAVAQAYVRERDVVAETFVSFLGYQVRLHGTAPGLRSLYSLNLNADAVEGITLCEIGAIMALGEGYELSDLTPENAAAGMRMVSAVLYADGVWDEEHIFKSTVDGEEKNCFAYTTMYNSDFAATKYSAEMLYRAYVKLEVSGETVTLYTDMTSSLERVSLLSVTEAVAERDETVRTMPLIKNVLESTFGEVSNKLTVYESTVSEAEQARLDAIAAVETARARALALKEEIKAIAEEGKKADENEKQALLEEVAALLADCEEISAQAKTAFPSKGDDLALVVSEAEDLDRLVALVDSESALRGRIADLIVRATAEKAAQDEGYSEETLWKKTDALDALSVVQAVSDRLNAGDFGEVKTLKVLAIGNSFSNNAMSQLYEIAKSFGYEDIVLGNLYIGGCSIEKHYNNAKSNAAAYDYRKNTGSGWRTYESSTLLNGLQEEAWDVITFQQVSHYSAQKATLTDGKLDYLINYVDVNKTNEEAAFYYHATWAYATDHTHPNGDKAGFEYLNDQAEMDALIAEAVEDAICTRDDIDGVIYTGVAIAEARKYFGDAVASKKTLYTSPDGYHLGKRGCYIIGLVWFATLTGEDITNAEATSTSVLSGDDLIAAIDAAKAGLASID